MDEPIIKPNTEKSTYVEDLLIKACAEVKAASVTMDELELRARQKEGRFHTQIKVILDNLYEYRTTLAELLAEYLIETRK